MLTENQRQSFFMLKNNITKQILGTQQHKASILNSQHVIFLSRPERILHRNEPDDEINGHAVKFLSETATMFPFETAQFY